MQSGRRTVSNRPFPPAPNIRCRPAATTRRMAVPPPRRVEQLRAAIAPFMGFFTGPYAAMEKDPEVANFAVGNPQELAMPAYGKAIRDHPEPPGQHTVA